jgi:hypothetical protein
LLSVCSSVCASGTELVRTTSNKMTAAISSKLYRNDQYQVYFCISSAFLVLLFLSELWPFKFFFIKFCLDYFSYTTYVISMKLYRIDQYLKYLCIINGFSSWLILSQVISLEFIKSFWSVNDFSVSCYTVATTCYKNSCNILGRNWSVTISVQLLIWQSSGNTCDYRLLLIV